MSEQYGVQVKPNEFPKNLKELDVFPIKKVRFVYQNTQIPRRQQRFPYQINIRNESNSIQQDDTKDEKQRQKTLMYSQVKRFTIPEEKKSENFIKNQGSSNGLHSNRSNEKSLAVYENAQDIIYLKASDDNVYESKIKEQHKIMSRISDASNDQSIYQQLYSGNRQSQISIQRKLHERSSILEDISEDKNQSIIQSQIQEERSSTSSKSPKLQESNRSVKIKYSDSINSSQQSLQNSNVKCNQQPQRVFQSPSSSKVSKKSFPSPKSISQDQQVSRSSIKERQSFKNSRVSQKSEKQSVRESQKSIIKSEDQIKEEGFYDFSKKKNPTQGVIQSKIFSPKQSIREQIQQSSISQSRSIQDYQIVQSKSAIQQSKIKQSQKSVQNQEQVIKLPKQESIVVINESQIKKLQSKPSPSHSLPPQPPKDHDFRFSVDKIRLKKKQIPKHLWQK